MSRSGGSILCVLYYTYNTHVYCKYIIYNSRQELIFTTKKTNLRGDSITAVIITHNNIFAADLRRRWLTVLLWRIYHLHVYNIIIPCDLRRAEKSHSTDDFTTWLRNRFIKRHIILYRILQRLHTICTEWRIFFYKFSLPIYILNGIKIYTQSFNSFTRHVIDYFYNNNRPCIRANYPYNK